MSALPLATCRNCGCEYRTALPPANECQLCGVHLFRRLESIPMPPLLSRLQEIAKLVAPLSRGQYAWPCVDLGVSASLTEELRAIGGTSHITRLDGGREVDSTTLVLGGVEFRVQAPTRKVAA